MAMEGVVASAPRWQPPGGASDAVAERVDEAVRQVYDARGYGPLWIGREVGPDRAAALVEVLRRADAEGLDPALYDPAGLAARLARVEAVGGALRVEALRLDLDLTRTCALYALQVSRGVLSPDEVPLEWHVPVPSFDLADALGRVAAAESVEEALASLAPRAEGYARLRRALDGLGAGVTAVHRHGGAGALPVRRTVIDNMERFRWLPRERHDRFIVVNIPAFALDLVEAGEVVTSMKVAVGKEGWGTPVFDDELTTVILNPYWNVPASIAAEEIIPKVRRDPSYLEEKGFEVIEGWGGDERVLTAEEVASLDLAGFDPDRPAFRFRQRPGPENPLGRIKFLFPNTFDIYLHDTPGKGVFTREGRAVSHGCIRLEHPFDLALHVLGPDWDRRRLAHAVGSGERTVIHLVRPVPVHLRYRTAVAGPGGLEIYPDVYGVDVVVDAALRRIAASAAGAEGEAVHHGDDHREE